MSSGSNYRSTVLSNMFVRFDLKLIKGHSWHDHDFQVVSPNLQTLTYQGVTQTMKWATYKKRSYPVSPRYSKTGMTNKVSEYLSSVKWSPINALVAVRSKVLHFGWVLVGISVIWMAGRNSYCPKCQSSVVYWMGYIHNVHGQNPTN